MAAKYNIFPQRLGVVVAGVSLTIALPTAAAQTDSLAMLSGLTKGEWTINYRGDTPDRKICVKSGDELIQLMHTQNNCSRYVVEDGASAVTVQYTCPGDGYGRTNIRRETAALVQIESQGIASGLPFQFAAEARRTGTC